MTESSECRDLRRFVADLEDFEHTRSCVCCNMIVLKNQYRVRTVRSDFFEPIRRLFVVRHPDFAADTPWYPEGIIAQEGLGFKAYFCEACHKSLSNGNVPSHSKANLYLGPSVRDALFDLTWEEWRLISLVIAYQSVYRLNQGQYAVRGHAMCLRHEEALKSLVTKLPRRPRATDTLYICYEGDTTSRRFRCRPARLREALRWLKQHNPLYKDITIDDQVLGELEMYERNNVDDPDLPVSHIPIPVASADVMDGDVRPNESGPVHDVLFSSPHEAVGPQTVEEIDRALADQIGSVGEVILPRLQVPVPDFVQIGSFPFMAAAFPRHFPFGLGDIVQERPTKLTLAEYIKVLLLHRNSTFATDPAFIFFAFNKLQREQAQTSVRFALKHTHGRRFTVGDLREASAVGDWTSRALRTLEPFFLGVRGTALYWRARLREILALVQYMDRPPSFFATFSAADAHWPELATRLRRANSNGSDMDTTAVDARERLQALTDNPVLAALAFHTRWRALKRDILSGSAAPLGRVVDSWCRVEFQRRGSPHIHALLWIEGAPDPSQALSTQTGIQELQRWLSKRISADVPGINAEEVESIRRQVRENHPACQRVSPLHSTSSAEGQRDALGLMLSTQSHSCNLDGKCKVHTWAQISRLVARHDVAPAVARQSCLYAFPRPVQSELTVRAAGQQGASEPRYLFVNPQRRDGYINECCLPLLRAWRANLDLQFIGNAYGAATYAAAYSSKAEASGASSLTAALKALERAPRSDTTGCEKIRDVAMRVVGCREVSAQEAVFVLLGLDLVESTRQVVQASVRPHAERTSMMRPNLAVSDPNIEVACRDWVAKYIRRPASLEQFTAHQYLSEVHKRSGAESEARLRTRRRAVVSPYPIDSDGSSEAFCFAMLLLHTAYRDESSLVPAGTTARDMVARRMQSDSQFKGEIEKWRGRSTRRQELRAIESQERMEQTAENAQSEQMLAREISAVAEVGLMPSNNTLHDMPLPLSLQFIPRIPGPLPVTEEARNGPIEWQRAQGWVDEAAKSVRNKVREQRAASIAGIRALPTTTVLGVRCSVALASRILALGGVQRRCFQALVKIVARSREAGWLEYLSATEGQYQNIFVVSGKAGSGKSYLIRCIADFLTESLAHRDSSNQEPLSPQAPVIIAAYTGMAAHNVRGRTIHEAFQIRQIHQQTATPKQLHSLRQAFAGVELLVLDEFGMIPEKLFSIMNSRLGQLIPSAFQDTPVAFGGKVVLLCGDFAQLPPVAGKPLYQMQGPNKTIWQNVTHVFYLEQSMRQRGPANNVFVELLDRCAMCEASLDDFRLLQTRLESRVGPRTEEPWRSATWLNFRNADVFRDNVARLSAQQSPIVNIFRTHSAHVGRSRSGSSPVLDTSTHTQLLTYRTREQEEWTMPALLSLARGAPIMLTVNVSIDLGLVNGTCGIVHDILIPPGFQAHSSVEEAASHGAFTNQPVVLMRLDPAYVRSDISFLDHVQHIVPIVARKSTLTLHGIRYNAWQLPLKLAYSITIHKAQGRTLPRAVLNLAGVDQRALAYTALSRVPRLEDLLIRDDGFTWRCLNAGQGTEEHAALQRERRRLLEAADCLEFWGNGSYDFERKSVQQFADASTADQMYSDLEEESESEASHTASKSSFHPPRHQVNHVRQYIAGRPAGVSQQSIIEALAKHAKVPPSTLRNIVHNARKAGPVAYSKWARLYGYVLSKLD